MIQWLEFASDAEILGLWGAGFLALALVAMLGERLRLRRARLDRVGWVPWTSLFLACAIVGSGLIAMAAPGMLGG